MWFLLGCGLMPMPDASADALLPRADRGRLVKTFTVDCEGGADYLTIDDAVDDARSGDIVLVEPCTYNESVKFNGKALRIESTGGAAVTTIVAEPGQPAIESKDGEAAGAVVAGFTITGAGGLDEPAIDVNFSSLTLRDDVITGNTGPFILYSEAGHVIVERTTFEGNTPTEGAVVHERRGETLLIDATIRCGTGNIGYLVEHGGAFVDRTTFDCPGGVAMDLYHSDGRVQRSVLDGLLTIENEGENTERAVIEDVVLRDGVTIDWTEVVLRNVVSLGPVSAVNTRLLVEGSVLAGPACGVGGTGTVVTLRQSDLWPSTSGACDGNAAIGVDGVFSSDPRFVDRAGGDFRLASTSPCIDAGPTEYGYADTDGSPNDLGAYGGPLSIGGGW